MTHYCVQPRTSRPEGWRLALLAVLLCAALILAACGQPVQEPQPGQVFATLRITGGVAARDVTTTIAGDGAVLTTGMPARALAGGASGARELFNALAATGIYDVQPGSYLPANTCCDRQTYALTLAKGGKSYAYTTMDATEGAPGQLMIAVTLFQQYANAAK